MQSTTLSKYKLGLIVLGVLTLGLVGYVLVQASQLKQDNITQTKAEAIATKLNSYTSSKSVAPDSLDEAGIKDVPSTITYEKKTSNSYEFCMTFKAASDSFSTTGVNDVVTGAALLGAAGASSSSKYDYSATSAEYGTLLIGEHKKGKNCLTVKIYDPYGGSSSSSTVDCNYDYAKTDAENDAYYTCLDIQYKTPVKYN